LTQSLEAGDGAAVFEADPSARARSHLEVDLAAIEQNGRALRGLTHGVHGKTGVADLCAVVKKDAYGLGAPAIARRLAEAGAAMLALYDIAEAEPLLAAGVDLPLLVLGPTWRLDGAPAALEHARAARLHLAVHSLQQLNTLCEAGKAMGACLPLHFYLDTGMSRGGLNDNQLGRALAQAASSRHVRIAGLYSHLATADRDGAFAAVQRRRFEQAVTLHRGLLPRDVTLHLANTCGTLRDPALHQRMIRPGLGLFGFGPEQMGDNDVIETGCQNEVALRPAVRWVSRLTHVQRYPAGTPVGYGGTDALKRESLLGIVPVGYGDGYPLALSNQASVRLQLGDGCWHEAPVRGRINMDETIIDLTDAASAMSLSADRASRDAPETSLLGSSVELYSNDPQAANTLPRLAAQAQTHCYELLCRIAPHVERRYIG